MRISDWSSDVCSSDLQPEACHGSWESTAADASSAHPLASTGRSSSVSSRILNQIEPLTSMGPDPKQKRARGRQGRPSWGTTRSEEHTSELQSLMRISYAVC